MKVAFSRGSIRLRLYVNPKMLEFLGKDSVDVIGKKDENLRSPVDADHARSTDDSVLNSGEKYSAEESFEGIDGKRRYFWSTKVPLNLSCAPESLIGFSTEVIELREELER